MKLNPIVLAWLAALVAGCMTTQPAVRQEAQAAAPLTEEQQTAAVLARIGDATTLAVNAQRDLAMTADAKVARESMLRQRLLTDSADYDFYGDVEDILREIATKYAYDFNVYGRRPPERHNVNVFVKNRPVIEILKQIGYQSTHILDVKLTKAAIELHYKPQAQR